MDRSSQIHVVSSMATRRVLTELGEAFEATSPWRVTIESLGGVDAAKRVRAGEAFDVVVLSSDVIDQLIAEQCLRAGSRVDIVTSPVAVAIRTGAARPDVGSPGAVKDAVLAASRIGYSTGPSGAYLGKLFAQWGIADAVKDRITVATPGVPVGSLVARGDIDLGFQQLSELIGVDGIEIVGLLPAAIQHVTTFSGGVTSVSSDADGGRRLLEFMASPAAADVKRRYGMEPA